VKHYALVVLLSLVCAIAQASPSEELKALKAEEKALRAEVKRLKEFEQIARTRASIANLKAQLSAEVVKKN
jgi:cell division protein FtsB